VAREISLPLPSAADLFTTQEQRDEEKLERVRDIPLPDIDPFPGHPFKVRDDEAMIELAKSVREFGVQTPITVRPKDGGRYEAVSGHRRKRACELAGMKTIPAIVRDMSRDEAAVYMVDSNLQRERILPSEKAFSYKMKLEALNRQGKRTDLTSVDSQQKSKGMTSRELLSKSSGDSQDRIRAYIRLTHLIPPILDMVDEGRIAFRPAVEISYLSTGNQETLLGTMEANEATPSLAQAIKMKKFEQNERLTGEVILSIMEEEKPNQTEHFKLPKERIERFFAEGTKKEDAIETIVKALEQYFARERQRAARERGAAR
jgi:ParB family chromosome partitioning protein